MLFSTGIPCFLEAAREQNISKAAEKLYISRQAVSKQIQRLEQDLDTQLFYRSANQLTLTPAGSIYYNFFSDVMEQLEYTQRTVENMPKDDEVVRIAYIKGLNIEQQLSELLNRCGYPPENVNIVWSCCEPTQLTQGCLDREYDIIINYDRELESPVFDALPFLSSEFCLIAGKQLRGLDELKDWHELTRYSFFTWSLQDTTDSNSKRGFQKLCELMDIHPANVMVLSDMESLHTAVEMSSGITVAGSYDRLCASPMVNVYPTGLRSNLTFAWRKDNPYPLVRSIILSLKNELQTESAH